MKKISLKTMKNGLSRNEMRNVKGGCGNGQCSGLNCLIHTCCNGYRCWYLSSGAVCM